MTGKSISKGVIALYCEGLWLYCGLALFAKTQWEITNVQPYWLIGAALAAFVLHIILAQTWNNPVGIALLNVILLIGLLVVIWREVPSSQWGYGITSSIVHCALYIRSAFFALRPPTRLQMLSRFEGNLLFYLFFTLIFMYNPFMSSVFHVLFALAILFSLLGTVFGLHPEEHEEERIETKTVGDTGWFTIIVVVSIISTILFSLLLLLPMVREQVTIMLIGFWDGATQLGSLLLSALLWLLQLLPISEANELPLPEPSHSDLPLPSGAENPMSDISLQWFYILAGAVGIMGGLWLISSLLRQRKPLKRSAIKRSKLKVTFPWLRFWQWLKKIIHTWKVRMYQRFPSYYQLPIYWQYYQVASWGKRNALPRLPNETVHQYMQRLGSTLTSKGALVSDQEHVAQLKQIQQDLQELGNLYASAYYSQNKTVEQVNFQPLIQSLKKYTFRKKLKRGVLWIKK